MGTSGIIQTLFGGKIRMHWHLMILLCMVLIGFPALVSAQVYQETFDNEGDTNGSWWSTPSGNTSVQGGVLQLTSPTGGITNSTIWQTSTLSPSANCATPFFMVALPDVACSGTCGYHFEYYNSGSWSTVPENADISVPSIQLRLFVENVPEGQTVTLDNVAVYQRLSCSAPTKTDISCHGLTDGSITVNAYCGQGGYTYAWTGPDGYTSTSGPTISGLSAGDYSVDVNDESGGDALHFGIAISDPDTLTFSYISDKTWSCDDVPCTGTIKMIVAGGTPPFTYSLGATTSNRDTTFGGLCPGPYSINVEDGMGCSTASVDTSIASDHTSPVCTYSPVYFPNYYYDIGSGSPPAGAVETFYANSIEGNSTGATNDTMLYTVDATSYSGIGLRIVAHQTEEPSLWEDSDFLKILVDGTEVLNDNCRWGTSEAEPCDGNTALTSTAWIGLTGADRKSINVQIVCSSGSTDRRYTIDTVCVRGNSLAAGISPAVSGSPDNCTDDHDVWPATYSDGGISWIRNEAGRYEYSFTRTWTVSDECGNPTNRDQTIYVGSPPVFGAVHDTTIDFCHSGNVSLIGPTGSDLSDDSPDYSWEVAGTASSGSGNNPTITFEPPVEVNDTIYSVIWRITDDAGWTVDPVYQNVHVRKPMTISLVPLLPADGNFCTGNSASFTISVSGGTGVYENLNLLPGGTGSTWTSSAPFSTGTYTTTELTNDTPGTTDVISVTFRDVDISGVTGGCPDGGLNQQFQSGGGQFIVHDKITTNELNRD